MYLYSSTFIKSILDILLKYFSHPENKQVITQFIDHVNRHFVTFHQDDLSTSLFNVCEKYSIPLRGETQKVLLSGLGQIRDADRLDQKWEIQKKKYEGLYRTYLKLKLCKKSKNCYKNEIKSSINKIKSTLSIEFPNLTGI